MPDSTLTDSQLRELVGAHHNTLLSVARGIVGDSESEEVVQQAWLQAYNKWHQFEQRSNVRTWLTRIVINCAKMQLRSRKRETLFADMGQDTNYTDPLEERFNSRQHWQKPLTQWSEESPEKLLMRDQLARCLKALLTRMPAKQRALLAMRDHAQLGFEEICNELGVSASNARVLLYRARTQIIALTDHYEETGEC